MTTTEADARVHTADPQSTRTFIETVWTYRVEEGDLASNTYRILEFFDWSKGKHRILTTNTVTRLAEITVMQVMPSLTLGHDVHIRHFGPTVYGAKLRVTGTCVQPRDEDVQQWWHWTVKVSAPAAGEDEDEAVIAVCKAVFLAEVDRERYNRRLAPLFAARSIGLRLWLFFLNLASLLIVLATPIQMGYLVKHHWTFRITEGALALVWFASRKGWFRAIKDFLTIRPVSTTASLVAAPRVEPPATSAVSPRVGLHS